MKGVNARSLLKETAISMHQSQDDEGFRRISSVLRDGDVRCEDLLTECELSAKVTDKGEGDRQL